MLKWILRIGGGLVVVFGLLFWWLLLSSSNASKTAPGLFDLADWREKAQAPISSLPTGIEVIEVGRDTAPPFAAQAGRFGAPVEMSYNAVEIQYPNSSIIIGGAIDRATAEEMRLTAQNWRFDDEAYQTLTERMLTANQVLMTHEHLDHVMAIVRHPEPASLASNLVLNAPQIDALPMFALDALDPALSQIDPKLTGETQPIAPGVVIVPAAGHTPGSQNVFITLQNGEEILLIGDTVWNMGAIEALKTRPVLTQYMVFRPNYEDRAAVKDQVRALHDMMAANPDLLVLAAHDRAWLSQAADAGRISFLPAN
jgi:glyoxylase-like metal-dependent hydrolase (beta-lactamase superfamily II)